jgi:uncharacterized protein YdaU (DUF1376 family)
MPFYVGDYLSATGRLTTEQHGAYLLILLDYWKNGPPPNDDAVLAQIARLTLPAWRKAKPSLIGFFEIRDGHLIQKRVEKERERAIDLTEKRSKAGKASADARAKAKENGNKRSTPVATHVEANGEQNARPSQSPSSEDKSSGAKAPPDPRKQLIDLGLSLLMASGKSEKEARSLIGMWRKAKGDGEVLAGLMDCQGQDITNPVEWLQKRFQSGRWVSASGYEYRGSDQDVMRESERRGDMGTYWRVKAAMSRNADNSKPSKGRRTPKSGPIGNMISGLVEGERKCAATG